MRTFAAEVADLLYKRYRQEKRLGFFISNQAPDFLITEAKQSLDKTKALAESRGLVEDDYLAFCAVFGNELELEEIASEQRKYCRKWVEYCSSTEPAKFIADGAKPMACAGPDGSCDSMCPNYDKMSDAEYIEEMSKDEDWKEGS
jgi:hypothetical protein